MNRKKMPMVLMLTAGAATCLITYFNDYDLKTTLIALLAVLVIFYFMGCIIKMILDSFEKKNQKSVSEEGEVIEKESSSEEENEEGTPNP